MFSSHPSLASLLYLTTPNMLLLCIVYCSSSTTSGTSCISYHVQYSILYIVYTAYYPAVRHLGRLVYLSIPEFVLCTYCLAVPHLGQLRVRCDQQRSLQPDNSRQLHLASGQRHGILQDILRGASSPRCVRVKPARWNRDCGLLQQRLDR